VALDKQKIQVSIVGGLDTKTDEKNIEGVSFLDLENLRFTKTKSFTKRPGYAENSRNTVLGSDISSGAAITSFNNELLMFDGSQLFTHLNSDDTWKSRGYYTNAIATEVPAIGTGVSLTDVEFFSNGELTAYLAVNKSAGFSGEQMTVNIVDNADNKVLSTFNFGGYNGTVTKNKLGVGFLNGRFLFFYRNEADSGFVYRYVDLAALDTISPELLFAGASEIKVTSMLNSIYVGTLSGTNANVSIIPTTFILPSPVLVSSSATSAPAVTEEDLKVRILYTTASGLFTALYNQQVTAVLHAPVLVAADAYDFTAKTGPSVKNGTISLRSVNFNLNNLFFANGGRSNIMSHFVAGSTR